MIRRPSQFFLLLWFATFALPSTSVWTAGAQQEGGIINDDLPEAAKDIGVDSQIGAILDPDVSFTDDKGNFVRIKDLLALKRPLMLSFNYSDCPKLCSVQWENMSLALRDVKFLIGQDFDVVSISIDPLEQVSRARAAKEKYMQYYNKPNTKDGWHFLVGKEDDIKYLTSLCGFRYKYIKRQKLYSHPPVFILISPEGKIVRYIHGLDYDPATIDQALIETAEGKIGSPINLLSYGLGCFLFDESTGKYTFQAMAIMRIGGLITVLGLVVTLVPYWFFNKSKTVKKQVKSEPPSLETI